MSAHILVPFLWLCDTPSSGYTAAALPGPLSRQLGWVTLMFKITNSGGKEQFLHKSLCVRARASVGSFLTLGRLGRGYFSPRGTLPHSTALPGSPVTF